MVNVLLENTVHSYRKEMLMEVLHQNTLGASTIMWQTRVKQQVLICNIVV